MKEKENLFQRITKKEEVQENRNAKQYNKDFTVNKSNYPYQNNVNYSSHQQNHWIDRSRNFHPRWQAKRYQ